MLKINAEFSDTWKLFSAGGIFNDVERERFAERLSKVDEEAAAEAEAQSARLDSLREEQLARATEALEAFNAAFAVNLEDILHIEQIKMQQSDMSSKFAGRVYIGVVFFSLIFVVAFSVITIVFPY